MKSMIVVRQLRMVRLRLPQPWAGGFQDEGGQALVEFAIVLTVLLLIIMGILFFGRFMNYALDQTHLANEGARWAAVNVDPGGAATPLVQYIQTQADSPELVSGSSAVTKARVCISFPNVTSNIGDPVQVTVSSTYSFPGLIWTGLSPTVSEQATMRLEATPTTYGAGCSS